MVATVAIPYHPTRSAPWGHLEAVPRGDGWVRLISDPPRVDLEVKVATIGGRPELVGLRLDVPSTERGLFHDPRTGLTSLAPTTTTAMLAEEGYGGPVAITKILLRDLPLKAIKVAALSVNPYLFEPHPVAATRGRGPAPLPDSRFQQVAAIYKTAVDHAESPIRAIQNAYGLSWSGARRYAQVAEDRGFLGRPTRRGMPRGAPDASAADYARQHPRAPWTGGPR